MIGIETKATVLFLGGAIVAPAGAWLAQQAGVSREELFMWTTTALLGLIPIGFAILSWIMRQAHKEMRGVLVEELPSIRERLVGLERDVGELTDWMTERKREHAEANREMRRRAEEMERRAQEAERRRDLRRGDRPPG